MGLFSRFCVRPCEIVLRAKGESIRLQPIQSRIRKTGYRFPLATSADRSRGHHARIKEIDGMTIQGKVIPI
jgi:hypothetical protein